MYNWCSLVMKINKRKQSSIFFFFSMKNFSANMSFGKTNYNMLLITTIFNWKYLRIFKCEYINTSVKFYYTDLKVLNINRVSRGSRAQTWNFAMGRGKSLFPFVMEIATRVTFIMCLVMSWTPQAMHIVGRSFAIKYHASVSALWPILRVCL